MQQPKLNEEQLSLDYLPVVKTYNDLLAMDMTEVTEDRICYVTDEDTFYAWDVDTQTWIVPTAYSKGFTSGCRLKYYINDSIIVNSGVIEIKGKMYEKSSDIILDFVSNVDLNVVKEPDTWYYVYLEEDLNDSKSFIGFISTDLPNRDQFDNFIEPDSNKAKYHPIREARFVGSFKTDSNGDIIPFRIINGYIAYIGQGGGYLLLNGNSTVKTPINCRSLVPYTSSLAQVYYETPSNTGGGYRYIGDQSSWYVRLVQGSASVIMPLTGINLSLLEYTTATASSYHWNGDYFKPENAIDNDNLYSSWEAHNINNEWLCVNFSSVKKVNKVVITEKYDRITSFDIQYYDGSNWETVYSGTSIGTSPTPFIFNTIETQKIRIYVHTATSYPNIMEFEVYGKDTDLDYIYYMCQYDSSPLSLGIHGYYEDI